MISLKSSLPVFFVLSSLISPLAMRADQSQPAQNDVQQATEISYQNLQSDPALLTANDTAALLTTEGLDTDPIQADPIQVDPIMIAPIEISPIYQPIQLPTNGTPVDQPLDPSGPGGTAVTPEPSGFVLLATGLLCGLLFWKHRESFAIVTS